MSDPYSIRSWFLWVALPVSIVMTPIVWISTQADAENLRAPVNPVERPSTNPWIKCYIENARAALAAVGVDV